MSGDYPSTTLILVRHGQARSLDGSYGRQTPLSDLGRRQAKAVSDRLGAEFPSAPVYASPVVRAVETSAPLCEKLGVKAVLDSRLAEFEIGDFSPADFP